MEIKTQNICVSFNAKEVLKGISLNAHKKEFVGIIGPNGSGKSTLLKCIYRTLKPQNGAVYLNGQELCNMSVRSSAQKIAVVAQHNYYNFDFSVREVVMMGRSPHKKMLQRDNAEDFQIVDAALKTVQMDTFADRCFSTLSGGEQQRVILARALAQQTPALILDEPTNHLDITHQLLLLRLVKKTRCNHHFRHSRSEYRGILLRPYLCNERRTDCRKRYSAESTDTGADSQHLSGGVGDCNRQQGKTAHFIYRKLKSYIINIGRNSFYEDCNFSLPQSR